MTSSRLTLTLLAGLLLSVAPNLHAAEIAPGLYLRTTYAFGNLSLSTIYVGADYQIALDPRGGVDPFDFAAAAKDANQKVGTFKIEGQKIVVTWTGGKIEKLDVEFDKGAFSAFDGGLTTKADAYSKDQTLVGQFAGSAQTANVSSSLTIQFAKDGTYSLSRLGGVRGTPGNNGVAQSAETGKYQLTGNTLTMTSAAGKATKHTVLPMNTALEPTKAQLSDEHIIFDSGNLKREK